MIGAPSEARNFVRFGRVILRLKADDLSFSKQNPTQVGFLPFCHRLHNVRLQEKTKLSHCVLRRHILKHEMFSALGSSIDTICPDPKVSMHVSWIMSAVSTSPKDECSCDHARLSEPTGPMSAIIASFGLGQHTESSSLRSGILASRRTVL